MRHVARAFVVLAITPLAAVAHAQIPAPATRYDDRPPFTARTELERRIEGLAAEVAAAEHRTVPRPDARLERAMTALATLGPDDVKGGPSNDIVEDSLRLYGIVEPPPHLIVARAYPGSDGDLLNELRTQLPRALAGGHYGRVAAAVVLRNGRQRVIVALGDSYIELAPVPRELPSGGPTPISGKLLGAFERPEAIITQPDGHTLSLPLTGDAKRFDGQFRCGPARGRYELEIAADARLGPTVLANFPIYCGMPAPQTLTIGVAPHDAAFTDASSAEKILFQMVNADRAHASLPPLTLDPRLVDIARGHSRDMLQHGFVGHVSPTTGDAAARVSRAKIAAQLVLENVARAGSPGEVERGLMDSPGHRRNILSSEAQRIGIGVVMTQIMGGQAELLVTQLFIATETPFHPADAEELRARVIDLRRAHGLAAPLVDPALDRIAASVAEDLASGRLTPQSAGPVIDRAIEPLGTRYISVRSFFAVATAIDQVISSLKDPLTTRGTIAIGVGIAPGAASNNGAVQNANGDEGRLAHHALILTATPR